MRKLFVQATLTVLLALVPFTVHSAIFNDGNDRKFVKDLRKKAPATLALEEKAILTAANRMGSIGLCDGKQGGNAFLVRFNGRDAVVTSAHMMMDKFGTPKCDLPRLEDGEAIYMPNTSLYDPAFPDQDKDFLLRKVGIVLPPVNAHIIQSGYQTFEGDFAVFYLAEQISGDRMPDGSERGALNFSSTPIEGDRLFMIGLAKDIGGGLELVYQKRCMMIVQGPTFFHGCDTLKGSSASLLATLEGDVLTFRGLHTSGTEDVNQPAARIKILPNIGTSSDHVRLFMEAQLSAPNPTFMPYYIQWVLHRTGCYSGKLDNQWGAESRKALAAFVTATGVTLPDAEPSAELLAAVEKVMAEGAGRCPQ